MYKSSFMIFMDDIINFVKNGKQPEKSIHFVSENNSIIIKPECVKIGSILKNKNLTIFDNDDIVDSGCTTGMSFSYFYKDSWCNTDICIYSSNNILKLEDKDKRIHYDINDKSDYFNFQINYKWLVLSYEEIKYFQELFNDSYIKITYGIHEEEKYGY